MPYGSDGAPGAYLNKLGFAEPEQDDGLFDIRDAERLVILIQYQHLTAQRRAISPGRAIVGYRDRTERSECTPPYR